MKKIVQFMKMSIFISLLTLVFSTEVKAQDFSPFFGDNYAGITGITNNPASIANSRYIFDATIFGFSTFEYQNFGSIQRKFVFNQIHPNRDTRREYRDLWSKQPWTLPENADAANKYIKLSGQSDRLYDGIAENEIQLFNFMVAFGPKFSLGVSERVRMIANVDNAPWSMLDPMFNDTPLPSYGLTKNVNTRASGAIWNQVGLTLASQIWDGGKHYIKAGVSFNVMKGLSSVYAITNNLSYEYLDQETVQASGEAIYGSSEGLFDKINELRNDDKEADLIDGVHALTNDFFSDPFAKQNWEDLTFGLDVGLVYEWRPDYEDYLYDLDGKTGLVRKDLNKYRIKVSAAVLDIPLNGGLKYNRDATLSNKHAVFNNSIYDLNTLGTLEENGIIVTDDVLAANPNTTVTGTSDSAQYQVLIPTRLTFSVDFRFAKNFYVNLGTSLPFTVFNDYAVTEFDDSNFNTVKIHSDARFNLTPRYERKWFGAAIPVTYTLLNSDQVNVGLGLRLGPVWVGSTNLFTGLIKEYSRGFDLCAAIKIPIFYGAPKDADQDGVSDKYDECQFEKGTWETRGCPDFDGDGIVDDLDECPCDPGIPEFNGCPDTDGDGIPDHLDDCPDVPGLPEFNGCPDTDGDGIPDHLDLCPEEPGVPEYKGCPESMFIQDTDGDGIPDNLDDCPLIPGTIENNGCPEETVTYSFDYATVNFDINKYNIKSPADEILDKVVELTQNNKAVSIKVVGHADITGNDAINDPLSVNRAESVKSYLVKRGVDGSIIETEGRGSHDPVATNSTREGRAKNRRVDLEVSFIKK
ncbi:MAG: DUF5723 family protein [Bacteroidales bacterium]|jgi:hypothetical protein